ncbi:MAG: NAD(P)H-dependent oxidoreductase [Verrucomicrobia bacterium]|nr:NAD(P)H-dependent oxidoreductase [Verrucomicrobiota bacterium]
MTPVSDHTLTEALHWRYATKKFDSSRKIPAEQWKALEASMVLAPSSFGLQPWRFIVVESPELRAQLPAISWGQTQTVEASHMVVFAYRKGLSVADVDHFIARIAQVRNVTLESLDGYRGFILNTQKQATEQGWVDNWSSRQVYIALGQTMAAAALLGIDTCPLEGIEAAKYDALLGLEKEGYASVCGLALGYRAEDDKYAHLPKVRFATQDVVKYL